MAKTLEFPALGLFYDPLYTPSIRDHENFRKQGSLCFNVYPVSEGPFGIFMDLVVKENSIHEIDSETI